MPASASGSKKIGRGPPAPGAAAGKLGIQLSIADEPSGGPDYLRRHGDCPGLFRREGASVRTAGPRPRHPRLRPERVPLPGERIYELARRARVQLEEVYVPRVAAPEGERLRTWATAASLLADYLVAHLSRRELEAVMAHEIGHLGRRQTLAIPLALLAIYLGWTLASALIGDFVEAVDPPPAPAERPGAAALPPAPVRARGGCPAARLTGDPEALISALGKLARLASAGCTGP